MHNDRGKRRKWGRTGLPECQVAILCRIACLRAIEAAFSFMDCWSTVMAKNTTPDPLQTDSEWQERLGTLDGG